jgi:hypothetical protein
MNRSKVMIFAALLVIGTVGWAQEFPKVEVGADYSYMRFAPSTPYSQNHSLNGGGGSFTYNLTENLGIKAEFQGYGSTLVGYSIPPNAIIGNTSTITGNFQGNLFTYLFGPQVKFNRHHKVAPFVHGLFGGAHSNEYVNAYKTICQPIVGGCSGKGTPANDGFAMAIGGGIDIPVNKTVSIRPAGLDYLMTRFTNPVTGTNNQSNFRYTAGVVFTLGGGH